MATVREKPGLAQELANELVRVLRDYTGRGPNRTQVLIQRDIITCILRESLTKGEQRLVEEGSEETVLRLRKGYQDAMRDELTAMVERITGRQVAAFMSDNHLHPDICLEVFVLSPDSDGEHLPHDMAENHEPSPVG